MSLPSPNDYHATKFSHFSIDPFSYFWSRSPMVLGQSGGVGVYNHGHPHPHQGHHGPHHHGHGGHSNQMASSTGPLSPSASSTSSTTSSVDSQSIAVRTTPGLNGKNYQEGRTQSNIWGDRGPSLVVFQISGFRAFLWISGCFWGISAWVHTLKSIFFA